MKTIIIQCNDTAYSRLEAKVAKIQKSHDTVCHCGAQFSVEHYLQLLVELAAQNNNGITDQIEKLYFAMKMAARQQ